MENVSTPEVCLGIRFRGDNKSLATFQGETSHPYFFLKQTSTGGGGEKNHHGLLTYRWCVAFLWRITRQCRIRWRQWCSGFPLQPPCPRTPRLSDTRHLVAEKGYRLKWNVESLSYGKILGMRSFVLGCFLFLSLHHWGWDQFWPWSLVFVLNAPWLACNTGLLDALTPRKNKQHWCHWSFLNEGSGLVTFWDSNETQAEVRQDNGVRDLREKNKGGAIKQRSTPSRALSVLIARSAIHLQSRASWK